MKPYPMIVICVGLIGTVLGCSAPQDIAGGAVQTGGGALNTAGQATVGAADVTGQAAVQVLGTTGEAAASVVRGTGEAATEATGGEGGMVREAKKVGDEIGKKRTVDFMGNEVVIDPSEDKKIRMAF